MNNHNTTTANESLQPPQLDMGFDFNQFLAPPKPTTNNATPKPEPVAEPVAPKQSFQHLELKATKELDKIEVKDLMIFKDVEYLASSDNDFILNLFEQSEFLRTPEKWQVRDDVELLKRLANGKLITGDMGNGSVTIFDGGLTPRELAELDYLRTEEFECLGKPEKSKAKKDLFIKIGIKDSKDPDTGEKIPARKKYKLTKAELLELPSKYPDHAIIFEYAHLGVPETDDSSSLSQSFVEEQLDSFYKKCYENSCPLRFISQEITPRVIASQGLIKDDLLDPISIWLYVMKNPDKLNLMKPPTSFETSPIRQESHRWIDESNDILNLYRLLKNKQEEARSDKNQEKMRQLMSQNGILSFLLELIPKMIDEDGNPLVRFIDHTGDGKDYTMEVLEAAGLIELSPIWMKKPKSDEIIKNPKYEEGEFSTSVYHKGKSSTFFAEAGDIHIKNAMGNPMVATIIACFLGEKEGRNLNLKIRLRGSQDDKRAASWKWAKNYYFRLSAFHRKAGVAASNVKHWGARAYVKKKILEVHGIKLQGLHEFSAEENKLFQKYRRLYFHKYLKLMFNFIKDEVAKKYSI